MRNLVFILLACVLAFTPAWVRAQSESPAGPCDFNHHKRSALLDLMLNNNKASIQMAQSPGDPALDRRGG